MYTSGTTGNPKGAKINHMMNLFNTINVCGPARITSRTSQLVILPLFHTGGLNMYANPVLHQGGEIVIMREFNPSDALDAINDSRLSITHLFGVPAPLQFMMQDRKFDIVNFDTLEVVGVGGAPCAEIIIKNWQSKNVDVIQGWGMTETSPTAFICEIERILDEIGIPHSLAAIDVPDECAERISHKALEDSAAATNPRAATAGEIRMLIEEAISKAR